HGDAEDRNYRFQSYHVSMHLRSGPFFHKNLKLCERTHSLAGCPAERGSGGALWETPKRLGTVAPSYRPRPCRVNTHFCVLVGILSRARGSGMMGGLHET